MPTTKVIKPKSVEAARKTLQKSQPVKVTAVNGAQSGLEVPAVRKSRASSCPRCPQRDRCERSGAAQRTAFRPGCERRARSSSKATNSGKQAAVSPQCREVTACPGRRETKHASVSHRAFTVIPPDPKKRREIQRKAEAELAALEALRLSRAMAYVSINPSTVGGCMSLEEVRLKQQQEMLTAKRKQKPMKMQVTEQTPVLSS